MLIFTFNVCSDTLDLLLLQSSSSNEGNNWVTISSSVIILAKLVAITAKYLSGGSPGRAAVISNASSVQAVGILLPTDNSRSYQGSAGGTHLLLNLHHLYSVGWSSSRWQVRCETGLIQHFYVHLPEFYRVVGCARKTSAYPSRCEDRPFLLIITRKKKRRTFLCCAGQ